MASNESGDGVEYNSVHTSPESRRCSEDHLQTIPSPLLPVRRSFEELKEQLLDYVFNTPGSRMELIGSIIWFLVANVVPPLLSLFYSQNFVIPYQVLDSGEVILDQSLNHEYKENETVPDEYLIIFGGVIPVAIIVVVALLWGPKHDAHAFICVTLAAIGFSVLVTDTLKIYVAKLRPNFYEMCEFNTETLQCETTVPKRKKESAKSFPSGHASFAFCVMTLISMYSWGKLGLHRGIANQQEVSFSPKKAFLKKVGAILAFLPLLFALFVAASRVTDFWHSPADVIAGSIIGYASAIFAHGLWYPSLHSQWAGFPLQTIHTIYGENSVGTRETARS